MIMDGDIVVVVRELVVLLPVFPLSFNDAAFTSVGCASVSFPSARDESFGGRRK